jgi:hypothetical protein
MSLPHPASSHNAHLGTRFITVENCGVERNWRYTFMIKSLLTTAALVVGLAALPSAGNAYVYYHHYYHPYYHHYDHPYYHRYHY